MGMTIEEFRKALSDKPITWLGKDPTSRDIDTAARLDLLETVLHGQAYGLGNLADVLRERKRQYRVPDRSLVYIAVQNLNSWQHGDRSDWTINSVDSEGRPCHVSQGTPISITCGDPAKTLTPFEAVAIFKAY